MTPLTRIPARAQTRKRILGIATVVVALVYTTIGTGGFKSLNWPDHFMNGKYQLLATALLKGSPVVAVPPVSPFVSFDLSLFHDHYFLYFGVVPALLLYMPVYFLSGGTFVFTDCLAVLFFSLGTFVITGALSRKLLDRFLPATPHWAFICCLILLGLCNNSITLLDFPRPYEVAISGAVFFQMLALACLLAFWLNPKGASVRPRSGLLAILSASLVLSIGCRPSFAFGSVVLLAITFWCLRFRLELKPRRFLPALLLPYGLGLLGLGYYNFIRFENWLEFGIRYQRTIISLANVPLFERGRILPGLFYYLIQWPIFKATFPYLGIEDAPRFASLPIPYHVERPLGLFAANPFVLLIPIGYWLIYRHQTPKKGHHGVDELVRIFAALGLAALLSLINFPAVVSRYNSDFSTSLILATCLLWCKGLTQAKKSYWLTIMPGLAVAYGVYVNLLVVLR